MSGITAVPGCAASLVIYRGHNMMVIGVASIPGNIWWQAVNDN